MFLIFPRVSLACCSRKPLCPNQRHETILSVYERRVITGPDPICLRGLADLEWISSRSRDRPRRTTILPLGLARNMDPGSIIRRCDAAPPLHLPVTDSHRLDCFNEGQRPELSVHGHHAIFTYLFDYLTIHIQARNTNTL